MISSWLGFREEAAKEQGNSGRSRFIGGLFDSVGYYSDVHALNPYLEGQVTDWDAFESLWEHSFRQCFRTTAIEHPLLLSESAWASSVDREKMAELAFEKFGAPALYFSSTAVLSVFACGKTSALVVDSGSSVTSVVPVYEGYSLKKGIRKQGLAGDRISDYILEGLKQQYKYKLTPAYQIQSRVPVEQNELPKVQLKAQPPPTSSYHKVKLQMAVSEFKESTCQVFETLYDEDQVKSRPGKPYEFSDGFNAVFGAERYHYPEILFQPHLLPSLSAEFVGVHQLALDAVAACDVELRPHLLSNVVATGGTTLFPGFTDRLSVELASGAYGQRIKISGSANGAERRYAAWLGGSILASLGTFHPLWLSKAEFQEGGTAALGKKFI